MLFINTELKANWWEWLCATGYSEWVLSLQTLVKLATAEADRQEKIDANQRGNNWADYLNQALKDSTGA